jgi:hypothetical protein
MKHINFWLSMLLLLSIPLTTIAISAPSTGQRKQPSTLDRLISIFRPQPKPGGTRGGVCLLTPLEPEEILWSDRPLFIWEAKISRIDVRLVTSQRVVWSQSLPALTQSFRYQGEPLLPGKTYEVIPYDAQGKQLITQNHPRFTLIDTTQQQKIQADLAQKEASWRNNRDAIEAIALEKALYLSEQGFWSDALQTLYVVPNPSLELRQFVQTTIQKVCQGTNVDLTKHHSRQIIGKQYHVREHKPS